MAGPEDLRDLLSRAPLPEGVVWAVSEPVADLSELHPEERAAISNAVPKRQAEFAGGRLAARAALRQLGLSGGPILKAKDRSPIWPEGVVASITHTGGLCLAMAARARDWRALGIDLELDRPMRSDLIPAITSITELARLSPMPFSQAAVRIFSAKEAAYKAQYPLTGALFGFEAMESRLPFGEMQMVAEIGLGKGARLPMLQIAKFDLILSLCAIPHA
ncbi:4'-phosphopantetheinyl transferase family protein [Alloyangia pacifica]|uniref:Enterobactin synthase component D n=1 Tax=Alloyangia pacifica TaxID=311180 RepID=A0A1I6U4S3_9RHOB|nr:4'-phosphopantetheinyl transferase superfamily protein [Alloyangia pacifica]SDH38327.1 4'-phosphopantetheinyl transferase superfamily protein [Alloyangia pacifica]SFS96435.1 4'-phosphopantetheinyl transferase superfamily protein [Alloyangia pacifica]